MRGLALCWVHDMDAVMLAVIITSNKIFITIDLKYLGYIKK